MRSEALGAASGKAAVGIDDDYDIGRIRSDLVAAKCHRISLAATCGIVAFGHSRARCARCGRGVIAAVVGDYENVRGRDDGPQSHDSRSDPCRFVVRWDEQQYARRRRKRSARRVERKEAEKQLGAKI
ncbi:hypothetical protein GCM10011393_09900 [Sphingopyxis bauzanensis]|nr:hypothetical protein GCM10011393_09900 [Sphingopyxis bauzanensis]